MMPAKFPQDDHPKPKKHRAGRCRSRPAGRRGGLGRTPDQLRMEVLINQLLRETVGQQRSEIKAALQHRLTDPATILDCLELLARLEGELPS